MNSKQIIALVVGIVLAVTAGLYYQSTKEVAVGGVGSTGANNVLWKLSGGNILPALASWGLQLPSLPSENCIGTDANGVFQAGTCGGGGGTSEWTDNGAELEPNEGEGIKVDYVIATSTGTSSVFVNASTTLLSFTTAWGNVVGDLTGNADTATALAANGANCGAGNAPLGVDASGAVESCFDVWTEAENTAAAYLDSADIGVSVQGYNANTTILGSTINASELAAEDFGDFTCNGTTCSLDATYATSLDTAYNGGVSITADSGAVTITVPDASNNVGLSVVQNDVTNNPYALSVTSPSASQSQLQVISTNAGARGPDIELYHNSASPAINDYAGFTYYINNSSAAKTEAGNFGWAVVDETASSEDSYSYFQNIVAGSLATRLQIGYIGSQAGNGIAVGDGSNEAFIGSNGSTNLTLQTGAGTTGTITITNGANGDITLTPNGTGNVVCGAVCQLFASTNPTTASAGDIALDTTDNQLIVDNGTTDMVYRGEDVIFKVTIASTSVEFVSGGVIPIPPEKDGFVLTQYRCYVSGGTSVVVNLSDGTNDTETITCATTLTSDTDVATNDTFTAGELAEIQIGTITGSPDYLAFTAYGYWTRE